MAQTTKSLLLKSLREQIERAAAVNDTALLCRLTRAYNQTIAAAKKPRPKGVQPDSQAGKRLAKQEARSRALAAARAAYAATAYSSAAAVRDTLEPTPVPDAPAASPEPCLPPVDAPPIAIVQDGQDIAAPAVTVTERSEEDSNISQKVVPQPSVPQLAPAALQPIKPVKPVTAVTAVTVDTSNPETAAMLARVNERLEKAAAEKRQENARLEKIRLENERIAASPNTPNPYRPKLGFNPLLPRPDYDVPDDAHACGINSLIERDGYWESKVIHPSEGRYEKD